MYSPRSYLATNYQQDYVCMYSDNLKYSGVCDKSLQSRFTQFNNWTCSVSSRMLS